MYLIFYVFEAKTEKSRICHRCWAGAGTTIRISCGFRRRTDLAMASMHDRSDGTYASVVTFVK